MLVALIDIGRSVFNGLGGLPALELSFQASGP